MPDRASLPASLREEMPAPSAELTLIAVLIRAHLKTQPRKKRREFLFNVTAALEEMEMVSNVVRLRGREHDAAVSLTRKQATAWVRGMLGAFFAADMVRPE